MRIDTLKIENFKLFKETEFTFNNEFNLVVGENGSGKTSLLRAIAVALGGWAYAYVKDKDTLRPILEEEIREIRIDNRFDKTKNTSISASGQGHIVNRFGSARDGIIHWTRSREEGNNSTHTSGTIEYENLADGSFTPPSPLNWNHLGNDILEYIEKGQHFSLPLIAIYECDRLWISSDEKITSTEVAEQKYSRFDPYKDCFHTAADNKAIVSWLLKQELASLQKNEETPVLKSIRHAATVALKNCSGIRFDIEQSRVIVDFHDAPSIPFEHLSDGQRTILALFCDLARRASLLNPHLEERALKQTTGVVLIDELDLHLHPKWQRDVIENLRTTFPKIQFICTTHSPFLIQSLRSSEELIMIDGEPLFDYANKGIEEIAQNMGVIRPDVAARYEEEKEAAKTFLHLLEESKESPEEKQEEYKKQLAGILKPYADNPAYQAFLELQYAAEFGERL